MYFQNPANGYIEQVSSPGLWTLLFGPFYFASKGVWTHAAIAVIAVGATAGLSWLIYPFFAKRIVRTNFLRKGWRLTTEAQATRRRAPPEDRSRTT